MKSGSSAFSPSQATERAPRMPALAGVVPRAWPKAKFIAMERPITASVKAVASKVQTARSTALHPKAASSGGKIHHCLASVTASMAP
jgi:hypothetical protein